MYLDKYISEEYLKSGSKAAVALSGGADSVFLLHMLKKEADEKHFTLCAIHVNHMIRGEEADRDEFFCRDLCKSLGVVFFSKRRDVPSLAKIKGCSVEEAAREARYSVFEEVMIENEIPVIATAHNADDVAENMLIRLLRGTSLDGICGIPRERELSYGRVVRPILAVSKDEILGYCENNQLSFVTDSTNLCDEYMRNRIRHSVIPALREMNPSFLSVCKRNADAFFTDAEYLRGEADRLYFENLSGGCLSLYNLRDIHKALLSRIINKYCINMNARPEKEHIDIICSAVKEGRELSISIPGGRLLRIENELLFALGDRRNAPADADYEYPLKLGENIISFPESGLYVKAVLREAEECGELIFGEEKYSLKQSLIYNLSTHKVLNFDKIKGELFLRNRRAGDSIDLGAFRKSLKKLMSEKNIPKNIRDLIPCLCTEDEVIYVPFAAETKKAHVMKTDDLKKKYLLKLEINIDLTEERKCRT